MKWQTFLIFMLATLAQSKKNKTIAVVGNPLLHAHPCKDNEDITISFEPGLPPGEENQYNVYIKDVFPTGTIVKLKFDADATVTLADPSKARISSLSDGTFYIKYFKSAESMSFKVVGPATGAIPYLTSVYYHYVENCEEPKVGILDEYIQGYQPVAEVQLSVPDDGCGRRKIQYTELITNGLATKAGDWPWHTAIYRLEKSNIKYICGGTLISKTFVLTAAHCSTIRGVAVLPEILNVVLGKYNLVGGDVAAQEREVLQVIIHEEFTVNRLQNDISLLKLKTEATFSDYVQPACIWYSGALKKLPSEEIFGTVVGWGFDQTDSLSSTLRQATIPKVADATCIRSNPVFYGQVLNDRKFCAGLTNGTSACNGDSGGGFQVFVPDAAGDTSPNAKGAWYVRGIVSLTLSRKDAAICDPNQYVVFTDVAKYTDWLKKHADV